MYPIVPPILQFQFGPDVQNLQDVFLFLIGKGDILNPGGLSIPALEAERGQSYFGAVTKDWSESFKAQYALPSLGDGQIDPPAADQLNLLMAQYPDPPEESIIIRGLISHSSGSPLPLYSVRIEQVRFAGNEVLDTVEIDSAGFYTALIPVSNLTASGLKYMFQSIVEVDVSEEYSSNVITVPINNTNIVVIDMLLENQITVVSDFSSLIDQVAAIAGGTPIKDITIDGSNFQLDILSQSLNESPAKIANLVTAHRLSNGLNDLEPEFFYGLITRNLPSTATELLFQPAGLMKSALTFAVANTTISSFTEIEIDAFVTDLKSIIITNWNADNIGDIAKTATFKIYDKILNNTATTNDLLSIYFNFEGGEGIGFWDYLETEHTTYAPDIKRLKSVTVLGPATGNNPALAGSLQDILEGATYATGKTLNIISGDPQPELLAGIPKADWIEIITDIKLESDFIFPEFVEGDTDAEKIESYAATMRKTLVEVYPTYAFSAEVKVDVTTPFPALKVDMEVFLENNMGFDFRGASIPVLEDSGSTIYDFTGIADRAVFVEEIATVQRLVGITTSYPAISAMAADGLVSAYHVSRMEEAEFVTAYETALGGAEIAHKAYEAAETITVEAVTKSYEILRRVFDPGAYADPVTGTVIDGKLGVYPAPTLPIPDPYAEWRALFGAIDTCTCCHCQSVYSASAYLVDTLHFLKTKGGKEAHDILINSRRPDIKDIELTCDNTNIPLPYIDIVNEILEDIVSQGAYSFYARQTRADAAHQRALPEYVNTDGYKVSDVLTLTTPYGDGKLKDAGYPWTLPYNFYKNQIDAHLEIVKVNGHEIAQRFSGFDKLNAWNDVSFCTQFLGGSNEERIIITTTPTLTAPNYQNIWLPYGFCTTSTPSSSFRTTIPDPKSRGYYLTVTAGNWYTTMMNRVDVFLQQTKLKYKDLLELLDCFFLNNYKFEGRQFAILNNSSTTNIATCNLYELKIDAADAADIPAFLDKMHRFVRLSRALGWHYYDLDRALRAIGATSINEAAFKKLAQIKYLATTLNLSVENTCTLWNNIELVPYRDYGHEDDECELINIPNQYLRIFRNPAQLNANTENPFPPDPEDGFDAVEITKFKNHISGIISISPNDAALLLDDTYSKYPDAIVTAGDVTSVTPSISMLSYIYRQSILLKALKVSVSDWLYYRKWISNSNYFGNDVISPDAANNTSAIPISIKDAESGTYTAIPFDTIRFITFTKLFRDSGMSSSEVEYLLLDKPSNSIADDKANNVLSQNLTELRTSLAKSWYPDLDLSDANENAGLELKAELLRILNENFATRLLGILDQVKATPEYTPEDKIFISTELSFFLPVDADDVLANTGYINYESDLEGRYEYIYNNFKAYITESILKPAVTSALSKNYKLSEDIIFLLLSQVIILDVSSGFDVLLDKDFVTSTDIITRWTNHNDQFNVLIIIDKAALLINKFGLGVRNIQYLWLEKIVSTSNPVIPDILIIAELPIRPTRDTVFIPGTSSDVTFRLMRNLLQWMQVRAFTGDDINILFEALKNNVSANIYSSISSVFKTGIEDTENLLKDPMNILNADSTSFRSPLTYLRFIDCLEIQYLIPASMASIYNVGQGVLTADSQSDVAELIRIVKAQYDNTQWLEVIQPVSDKLRIERRDALLSFLMAYPPIPYIYSWLTSNDIYETLMVDVEMMPIMLTTRVLLAVNTVQVWMHRVMLHIEDVTIDNTIARQWNMWRKLYRVWEANRKIFLYPENWIEPELRDDKTPFFKELEKFLKQNELTKENVETAYRTYLERLDQVSHLDVKAVYREPLNGNFNYASFDDNNDANDTIHVFARTKAMPYIYFYRKRLNREWTAWEKIEMQIDGEHFVPIMWRGRLRLYWLVFTKNQAQESATKMRANDVPFVSPGRVNWKIQLAWTELKDGKWTPKEITTEAAYSRFIVEERPVSNDQVNYFKMKSESDEDRGYNLPGDLEIIKKECINFYADIDEDGNVQIRLTERVFTVGGNNLTDDGKYLRYPFNRRIMDARNYEASKAWSKDSWWAPPGRFIVKFNGVHFLQDTSDDGVRMVDGSAAPGYPKVDSLYMDGLSGKFTSLQNNGYMLANTDYWYRKVESDGYSHFPDGDVLLLGKAPGHVENAKRIDTIKDGLYKESKFTYTFWYEEITTFTQLHKSKYLVFPRNVPAGFSSGDNLAIPYFFYKDYTNDFFVEKVKLYYSSLDFVSDAGTVVIETKSVPVTGGGTPAPGTGVFKADKSTGTSVALGGGIDKVRGDILHLEPGTALGFSAFDSESETVYAVSVATAYRFHTFKHDKVQDFMEALHLGGLDGLLRREYVSSLTDTMDFTGIYEPTGNVHHGKYTPHNGVNYEFDGAYSMYNWELFFHIPLLIANKLSQDQRFDEARNWYHYVFNPTNNDAAALGKGAYWNFQPFFDIAEHVPTIAEVMSSTDLSAAISRWANDPFKPHLVARTRIGAYMKNTVMKYLDNLIGWGDNLFRSDSREAINEATLLYVLALQILGRRPEKIPMRAEPVIQTYDTIKDTLNDFGNALVKIENVLLSSGVKRHDKKFVLVAEKLPDSGSFSAFDEVPVVDYRFKDYYPVSLVGNMYYFCTPTNDKLLQYWDILEDRLFKIRNSQNIDGVTRDLALFSPPIDPAILVKAAASGVSLAGVLSDMTAPMPSYRFNVLSQKASELVQEVKSLGGQMLSALEKKDAEKLSLLRNGQEINVLQAVTELKEKQIEESTRQFEVLGIQLKSTTQRRDHYQNLINNGLIGKEQTQLDSAKIAMGLTIASATGAVLAAALRHVPEVTIGAFSFGGRYGGANIGDSTAKAADALGIASDVNNHVGQIAGINAGFERRKQDWDLQLKLANIEIEQLNKQLIAAEIRKAMSEVELRNHKMQVQNAQDLDIAMRDKYTNEDLYDWMIGQLSFTYFQSYNLAYEIAKKAEKCFRYELNLDTSDYIQFGYWDSLHKGLYAGESLAYDLKRMEAAFLDKNKRQLELTKHVSLAALNPLALMKLTTEKTCQVSIPEWLFDMDYPGQHMRRIKSVSISIPCVAGPYTTISCKLSLTSSKYRKNAFLTGGVYVETGSDTRFNYMFGNIQSIATSGAQNDSGMFEMNFRDERYLPFEGCGAISTWTIDLPAAYAQFDYSTIADVILHIKYTAQDSGALKAAAITSVGEAFKMELAGNDDGLFRLFNLKQEFSNEWHQLVNGTVADLVLTNIKQKLPYLVQGLTGLVIESATIYSNTTGMDLAIFDADETPVTFAESPITNSTWVKYTAAVAISGISFSEDWHIAGLDTANVKELWMVIKFKNS